MYFIFTILQSNNEKKNKINEKIQENTKVLELRVS